MRSILAAAAALGLLATPTLAAAAPTANPAASLSIAKARAGTPTTKKNGLAGAGLLGAVILAGVAAIGVVAIVNEDDSDSN